MTIWRGEKKTFNLSELRSFRSVDKKKGLRFGMELGGGGVVRFFVFLFTFFFFFPRFLFPRLLLSLLNFLLPIRFVQSLKPLFGPFEGIPSKPLSHCWVAESVPARKLHRGRGSPILIRVRYGGKEGR